MVGTCHKFLINIDFFFLYRIFLKLIYCCNIRFLYRIRKVVRNISINILCHEGKKL